MPKRKAKLPPDKTVQSYAYRAGKVRLASEDGIRMVLATESPVRVWDYGDRVVVDEILRMDGLEFPQQIPLLNSHARDEARDVIGSIRDLQVSGDRLEGTAYFATSSTAQEIRKLYEEGHLTDFSIGFQSDSVEKVKRDETRSIGGRKYAGPLRVIVKSKVKEGSAVAIGADENAKALREWPALRAYFCPDQCLKESKMDELRDFCLTHGMPADTRDEDIRQWMNDNLRSSVEEDPKEEETKEGGDDPKEHRQSVEDERQRASEITAMCGEHGLSQQQAASYIKSSLSTGEVSRDILRKISQRKVSKQVDALGLKEPLIRPFESETDKFMAGARGALISRCLMGVNINTAEQHAQGSYENGGHLYQTNQRDQTAIEQVEEVKKLVTAPVARDFRNVGLCEMARMFVEQSGTRTWGMSKQEIVRAAFRLDMYTRDEAAYHTTGSFTNVLLDSANKTLLMAYEEANVTYPLWVRQAPSTADFKTINRIRLGEVPSPDIVPENAPYGEVAVTDSKESYTPDKYGHIFSISLEAIVNDDLNAISRIPAQQGYAMRRKINQVCYGILTANAPLSDGVALFHGSSHGANLDAVALSATSLNTGFTVMMTQTGLNSGVTLNITPRFLIVPPSLASTAYRLTMSLGDPTTAAATTEDAARPAYNSGVINLYGPQGPRSLMPIVDAVLEVSPSTWWWLAAESNQIDTVELTFLQGEETPYVERKDEFCVDAVRYKIRQTFGAKAIDYRGLYQGNG